MVDMVSWALCSAHSSIMDGKSDTVTAVALRGSERERGKVRDGEIEREREYARSNSFLLEREDRRQSSA